MRIQSTLISIILYSFVTISFHASTTIYLTITNKSYNLPVRNQLNSLAYFDELPLVILRDKINNLEHVYSFYRIFSTGRVASDPSGAILPVRGNTYPYIALPNAIEGFYSYWYVFTKPNTEQPAVPFSYILLPYWSRALEDLKTNTVTLEIGCGFPVKSFRGSIAGQGRTWQGIIKLHVHPWIDSFLRTGRVRSYPYSSETSYLIPAIPIWRGFLLNSLVYLCMIGFADLAILRPTWRHAGRPALRSLRSWRRRRRIIKLADRRGLCPNCKHPLVPAATDPATNITTPRRCTECGWSDATPPPASQPISTPTV